MLYNYVCIHPHHTQVQEILSQAKFIQPSLGELPGALKARLGDSNKNHVSRTTYHMTPSHTHTHTRTHTHTHTHTQIITTVNIIASMATAMGSPCVKFTRVFIPGVLQNLADGKVIYISTVSYLSTLYLILHVSIYLSTGGGGGGEREGYLVYTCLCIYLRIYSIYLQYLLKCTTHTCT